jgi:predicted tellurium resistance membrane protein TerC
MEWLADPQAWIALVTLTALELVLGIDNVVFISILAGKLPEGQRDRARKVGLGLAMLTRIALLLAIGWVIRLEATLFAVLGNEISGRDLILIIGGLFLIGKSTKEIHHKIEGPSGTEIDVGSAPTFRAVITQILLLDVVFSLDSVITAVGMVDEIAIMVVAIVMAMLVMLVAMERVSTFVESHPSVKLLALAFLILIGVILVADAFGHHVPKGYIYFSMAFSLGVELLNLRYRSRRARRRAA